MINKNNTLNFVYCFDSNYDSQAFSSIISLLDNVNEKIHIFIIHNSYKNTNKFPKKILNHENLNTIEIYKFEDESIHFPNLDKAHISEATYYRLFFEYYLPDNIDLVTYVDADMICVNNPLIELRKNIENLKHSEYILSAKTEILKNESEESLAILKKNSFFELYWPFERLSINKKYFNAGFMVIDLKKWRNTKFTERLLRKMKEIDNEIVAWDQDVLNAELNGRYVELNKSFSYYMGHYKDTVKGIYFLHFSGSKKPWSTEGVFDLASKYYHNNYSKVHKQNYHIVHNWKTHSVKQFFKALLTLNLFKLDKPLNYILEFIKSFK